MTFTLRTTLLLTVLGVFAMIPQSFALPEESIITTVKDKSITLLVESISVDPLKIQLSDLKGQILLSEELNTIAIQNRTYNLKNLPSGKYILEIMDHKNIITKSISIKNDIVTVTGEETVLKPAFFKNDYIWTLSILTFGEDATVKIYDDNGKELYSEFHKGEQSISRKYDMSNQETGEYRLMVLVGNRSFSDLMVII